MCKRINPCLCIPSGVASFLVAITDIVLGAVTLYYSWISYQNIEAANIYLRETNSKDDVLWFGIISIPFVAVIGVWSGIKLLHCLHQKSQESNHILKFIVFFIAEVVGFIAPFYIYEDYVTKINTLTSFPQDPSQFAVFRLLEVNSITVTLIIYQILSFWVVHRHQLLAKEAAELERLKTIPAKADYNLDRVDILPAPFCILPAEHVAVVVDTDSNSNLCDDEGSSTLQLQRLMMSSKFELLKQKCFQTETLFTDEEFPANQASIGSDLKFEWKRPHEIRKDPRFFTDGASRFDVRQGKLGNCWFLAAVGNLTLNEELFKQVVPCDNEWAEGRGYTGICHFRFWVGQEWKEVIIDDKLPTLNGVLVYLHSSDRSEFWSPLLEKAYAKLNGSYFNLIGNDGIGRAMENLTGGKVTRHYLHEFDNNPDKLFQMMSWAIRDGKLIGCCIRVKPALPIDGIGLFARHAYSITHANKIQMTDGSLVMALRIRNPWGNSDEWKGKFSDSHPIWESVDKTTRKDLQLIFRADGEFWVPLDDFMNYFDIFEICHLP